MIQFNLLPDVKIQYIKARRMKRLVSTVSLIVSVASVAILVLLFIAVNVVQKKYLNDLSRDIKADSKKLQEVEGLDKILTIQNQLNKLTPLHEQKAAATRIYPFISQLTPVTLKYESMEFNFNEKKIRFTGSADSIRTVNQYIDTLKFTKFKATKEEGSGDEKKTITEEGNAFSDVVLTEFGRDKEGASFQIDLLFDERIFNDTMKVTLEVPDTVTTRSVTEKPGVLFKQREKVEGSGGSN